MNSKKIFPQRCGEGVYERGRMGEVEYAFKFGLTFITYGNESLDRVFLKE